MQDNSAIPVVLPSHLLPPLEGEVCTQHIRCGKPGCRCNTGQLHDPYYYRIWREGTYIRKVYVKAGELEAVRAACEAHRNLSGSLRSVKQTRLRLTQSILKEWRQTQRYLGK